MPKGQYERKPRAPKVETPQDAEVERIAALLVPPAAPYPLPERTAETFDDWMEDEPAVVPADSRVTQMVGEWAGMVCSIPHSVTWLPSDNGVDLTVTLVTDHGTADLRADAGSWNEADITKALDAMRAQLGV